MNWLKLIWIPLIFGFCGKSSRNIEKENYYAQHCNSIDSIISFTEENPDSRKIISNSVIRFYYNGQPEKARLLLQRTENSPKINKSKIAKQYLLSDWGYYYLWEQQYDSCKQYINHWQALNHTDSQNNLIGIQLVGSYYYVTNNFDSSRLTFTEGYLLSKRIKDERSTERFANNLGAIAFQSGLYGTAAFYFAEANRINKSIGSHNPVLINNLAACYLNEGKIKLALELISGLENELRLENSTYEGFLTRLNYIEALTNSNQINLAKSYITASNWRQIPESLKGEYLVNRLKISKAEGWKDLNTIIQEFKYDLPTYKLKLLHKFGNGIIEIYHINPLILDILEINQPKDLDGEASLNAKHYLYHLLSKQAQKKGNYHRALDYILESNKSLTQYNNLNDSIKIADTESKINFTELEDKFRASQIELSHSKDLNKRNQTIIFLVSFLSFIFLGLGYYIYQNRNQKIRLAALELEAKSKEAEFLEQEQRLNSRILALSKIVIDKSKALAETIKKGPYSNEPEIHAVQKELERMSMIDAAVNLNPDIDIFENMPSYVDLPIFGELGETHKRVLILSVENYKAKEISTTLNLSYAYVRNVQTKLRKHLIALKIEQFSELKKFTS